MAIATSDGGVEVRDVASNAVRAWIRLPEDRRPQEVDGGTSSHWRDMILSIACAPDRSSIAAGMPSGEIFVWNMVTGERDHCQGFLDASHLNRPQPVTQLAFTPDSRRIVAQSWVTGIGGIVHNSVQDAERDLLVIDSITLKCVDRLDGPGIVDEIANPRPDGIRVCLRNHETVISKQGTNCVAWYPYMVQLATHPSELIWGGACGHEFHLFTLEEGDSFIHDRLGDFSIQWEESREMPQNPDSLSPSLQIAQSCYDSNPHAAAAELEVAISPEEPAQLLPEQGQQPRALNTYEPAMERHAPESSQIGSDQLKNMREMLQRLAPSGGYSASHPHPAANPDQAMQLNLEYQRKLAHWNALPVWKRWFTKRPDRPTGI